MNVYEYEGRSDRIRHSQPNKICEVERIDEAKPDRVYAYLMHSTTCIPEQIAPSPILDLLIRYTTPSRDRLLGLVTSFLCRLDTGSIGLWARGSTGELLHHTRSSLERSLKITLCLFTEDV
jgi:hypothetical protein